MKKEIIAVLVLASFVTPGVLACNEERLAELRKENDELLNEEHRLRSLLEDEALIREERGELIWIYTKMLFLNGYAGAVIEILQASEHFQVIVSRMEPREELVRRHLRFLKIDLVVSGSFDRLCAFIRQLHRDMMSIDQIEITAVGNGQLIATGVVTIFSVNLVAAR